MYLVSDASIRRQSLRALIVEALDKADKCEPLVAIHLATAIDTLDRIAERGD